MNYTQNLHLPQWEGSDRIHHDDFNEAFRKIDKAIRTAMPAGVIAAWSGAANAIPEGWALCNGSNGTPDLRSRFLVGAGSDYAVGDTGGAASEALEYHYFSSGSTMGHLRAYNQNLETHDNRPPYYALCFIMKK